MGGFIGFIQKIISTKNTVFKQPKIGKNVKFVKMKVFLLCGAIFCLYLATTVYSLRRVECFAQNLLSQNETEVCF